MILLDKPYVSDFLLETIRRNNFPVVKTPAATALLADTDIEMLPEAEAIEALCAQKHPQLYTNSENAIGWMARHLACSDLPRQVNLFKDKVAFREATQAMFPELHFEAIELQDLRDFSIAHLAFPFIVKPAIGFFSVGVHNIGSAADWQRAITQIEQEIEQVRALYPKEVLDTKTFIIESCIEGEEFAFDAYFDRDGNPVILNMLKHIFSSAEDVGDRVYLSSKDIFDAWLEPFERFLRDLSALIPVRNFPVHVEVRVDATGKIVPIEVNPMRFGGWCTTADMAYFAFGFNPYAFYFAQKRPDWASIFEDKADKIYSIIVLNNSTGIPAERIARFDYDRLLQRFEHPLELRRLDYRETSVFGFLFTETSRDNYQELEDILRDDLRGYVEEINA